jgi:tetratricopeptide (TPR) repeat protein
MALAPEQLERVDIGLTNLLCAEGLTGTEDLNIPSVLATLDRWAKAVGLETARSFPQFAREPADYENSEPYFRMLVLLTVLQRDLDVHYNMERVNDPDFGNSKDQFIHGLVNSDNGGTCVSMPVLYVAVGRRLGYPLKLVLAHDHVYCRWDDGKGTVKNFEGTGRGLSSYSDEHYREWPRAITDDELKHREFLVSLTLREELSVFLQARGHCLMDRKRYKDALDIYRVALKAFPTNSACQEFVKEAYAAAMPPIRVQPGGAQNPMGNFKIPEPASSLMRGR